MVFYFNFAVLIAFTAVPHRLHIKPPCRVLAVKSLGRSKYSPDVRTLPTTLASS